MVISINNSEKVDQIRKILEWWEDQLCPKCGGEIHIDGKYGCGQWYGKTESEAFSYCASCDYKHYISTHSDDATPDDAFLDHINEVVNDGM